MAKLKAREKILKERGLLEYTPVIRKPKRLQPTIKVTIPAIPKTPLMRYLEEKYRCKVEDVLVSGSLSVVAKRLGDEVDTSTLSRWIKRFKLRYSENNLPQCEGCKQYGLACQEGICYVLISLGLYDLIPIKQKEVLNEGNQNPNATA